MARENKLLFSRLIFRLLLRHTVGRWDRVSICTPREAGANEKGGHAAPKNDVTASCDFASLQASHLYERSLSYNTYDAMSDVTSAGIAARSASVAFHIGRMDSGTTVKPALPSISCRIFTDSPLQP